MKLSPLTVATKREAEARRWSARKVCITSMWYRALPTRAEEGGGGGGGEGRGGEGRGGEGRGGEVRVEKVKYVFRSKTGG